MWRTRNSAIGNGPVNALDSALRAALLPYYPNLERCSVDYKFACSTRRWHRSACRVLIESTDGKRRWGTWDCRATSSRRVGTLVDSVEYKLHRIM